MKKSIFKGIFDLFMAILLFLMFDKMLFGIKFHEIGGLVAISLFFLHILINRKWVVSITKNLFNKQIPIKVKINYFINFMLLLDVMLMLITGIFMSKIVFRSFNLPDMAMSKQLHFFSASAFIILLGVHIGFHWKWIVSVFKKIFKIPMEYKLNKVICYIMILVLICVGGYNITSSNFTRWIKSPFMQLNGERAVGEKPIGEKSTAERAKGEKPITNENTLKENAQPKQEKGKNLENNESISTGIFKAILIGLKFISIMSIFAIVTYYFEKIFLLKIS